jgi:hypothetical protein
MLIVGAVVVGVVALGYGIHRLLLWAEQRGHVYYLHQRRPPGAGLGLLAPIYEPEMEHVIEEEQSEAVRRQADESGEGGGRDETED